MKTIRQYRSVRFKTFCGFYLFLKKLFFIFHRLLYCVLPLCFSLSLTLFAFVARTGPCKFVRRRPGGGSISCGLISDRVDRSISYPLPVCSMFIKYWSAPRNDNRFPHFPVRCPYALIFLFNCYRPKRSDITRSAAGTAYRSRDTDWNAAELEMAYQRYVSVVVWCLMPATVSWLLYRRSFIHVTIIAVKKTIWVKIAVSTSLELCGSTRLAAALSVQHTFMCRYIHTRSISIKLFDLWTIQSENDFLHMVAPRTVVMSIISEAAVWFFSIFHPYFSQLNHFTLRISIYQTVLITLI